MNGKYYAIEIRGAGVGRDGQNGLPAGRAGRAKKQGAENQQSEADVYIFGDITSLPWMESDVASYNLAQELAALDVDVINVRINSYGGEVAEGLAIFNTLRRHRAVVKTYCDGFACSAASVVFMAGSERLMNSSSLLMIHNVWSRVSGDAEDLRKEADDLEIVNDATIRAYLDSGVAIDEAALRAMMDAETWIAPTDALELGFSTAIVGAAASGAGNKAASARTAVFRQMMADGSGQWAVGSGQLRRGRGGATSPLFKGGGSAEGVDGGLQTPPPAAEPLSKGASSRSALQGRAAPQCESAAESRMPAGTLYQQDGATNPRPPEADTPFQKGARREAFPVPQHVEHSGADERSLYAPRANHGERNQSRRVAGFINALIGVRI
jgi:ATP-dependent Clp protease protease subunit